MKRVRGKKDRGKGQGIDLTQKTSSRARITILYRFHPLHGVRFQPVVHVGLPECYVYQRADGRRLNVPIWMTEPAAADLRLSDVPSISVAALLDLAHLAQVARCALDADGDTLHGVSDAKREKRHGRTSSADASTRRAGANAADMAAHGDHRGSVPNGRSDAPGRRRRVSGAGKEEGGGHP